MPKLKIRSGVRRDSVRPTRDGGSVQTAFLHISVEHPEYLTILAQFVLDADQLAVLLSGGSVDVDSEV